MSTRVYAVYIVIHLCDLRSKLKYGYNYDENNNLKKVHAFIYIIYKAFKLYTKNSEDQRSNKKKLTMYTTVLITQISTKSRGRAGIGEG